MCRLALVLRDAGDEVQEWGRSGESIRTIAQVTGTRVAGLPIAIRVDL